MKKIIAPTMVVIGAILAFGTVGVKLANPELFATNETLVMIMFLLGAGLAMLSIPANLILNDDNY